MSDEVYGRVVDGDTGQPVADASVAIVGGPGPAPDIAALTDADGRFALSGLGPGRWSVRVHGPDGSEGEVEVMLPRRYEVEIAVHTEMSTPEQD